MDGLAVLVGHRMIDASVAVVVYVVMLPGWILVTVSPSPRVVTVGIGAPSVIEPPPRVVNMTVCEPGTGPVPIEPTAVFEEVAAEAGCAVTEPGVIT